VFFIAQHSAGEIAAAVKEGITLAATAYDVMENEYGTNAQVQQMIKYILGDDAGLAGKVETAKGE
jgi:hypothetical protein